MQREINLYYAELVKLVNLQQELTAIIDKKTMLHPAQIGQWSIEVSQKTVSDQLTHWPKGTIILPLPIWVEPDFGEIEYNGNNWAYSYTSQGVSFTNLSDLTNVIIEYAVTGEVCISEWGILCFLKSRLKKIIASEILIQNHKAFFSFWVERGKLKQITGSPEFPEQVFILVRE